MKNKKTMKTYLNVNDSLPASTSLPEIEFGKTITYFVYVTVVPHLDFFLPMRKSGGFLRGTAATQTL